MAHDKSHRSHHHKSSKHASRHSIAESGKRTGNYHSEKKSRDKYEHNIRSSHREHHNKHTNINNENNNNNKNEEPTGLLWNCMKTLYSSVSSVVKNKIFTNDGIGDNNSRHDRNSISDKHRLIDKKSKKYKEKDLNRSKYPPSVISNDKYSVDTYHKNESIISAKIKEHYKKKHEKYAEKYAEKDADKYAEKDADKYADKYSEKYAEKYADKYNEKNIDKYKDRDEESASQKRKKKNDFTYDFSENDIKNLFMSSNDLIDYPYHQSIENNLTKIDENNNLSFKNNINDAVHKGLDIVAKYADSKSTISNHNILKENNLSFSTTNNALENLQLHNPDLKNKTILNEPIENKQNEIHMPTVKDEKLDSISINSKFENKNVNNLYDSTITPKANFHHIPFETSQIHEQNENVKINKTEKEEENKTKIAINKASHSEKASIIAGAQSAETNIMHDLLTEHGIKNKDMDHSKTKINIIGEKEKEDKYEKETNKSVKSYLAEQMSTITLTEKEKTIKELQKGDEKKSIATNKNYNQSAFLDSLFYSKQNIDEDVILLSDIKSTNSIIDEKIDYQKEELFERTFDNNKNEPSLMGKQKDSLREQPVSSYIKNNEYIKQMRSQYKSLMRVIDTYIDDNINGEGLNNSFISKNKNEKNTLNNDKVEGTITNNSFNECNDSIKIVDDINLENEDKYVILKYDEDSLIEALEKLRIDKQKESEKKNKKENKYEKINKIDKNIFFKCRKRDYYDEAILILNKKSDNNVLIEKFNVPLMYSQIKCLIDSRWLNDEIINFYLSMLQEYNEAGIKSGVTYLPKMFTFSTFFFQSLNFNGSYNYSKVARWTKRKKIDILEYDLILIPLHVGGNHWTLGAINIKDKHIKLYDSLNMPNRKFFEYMKRYIVDEVKDKKQINIDISPWTYNPSGLPEEGIPYQENGYDCGVFTCMFAKCLTFNRDFDFSQSDIKEIRLKMVYEISQGHLVF
ncbi:sentrin-specific protease 1, putative [Plasmodium vinckei brucechwatti]|uniref:Sentrin-specific protease 1, putative n=1 Tax=Plasmodium vinckei brucechwatti TaxID=119398 RepID=A0A6V7T0S1_PLAVN|nr:sentrin-specific protease 1, putative [Plasmodium vinckei brucechwatti]